jgi:hypothetical protein
MSKFYTEKHRALQEKFDTRRAADLLENAVVHGEFAAHEAEFIQSRVPGAGGEISLDAYAELLAKGEAGKKPKPGSQRISAIVRSRRSNVC